MIDQTTFGAAHGIPDDAHAIGDEHVSGQATMLEWRGIETLRAVRTLAAYGR